MSKFVGRTNPKSVVLIPREAIILSAKRDAKGALTSYTFDGINFSDFPLLKSLPNDAKIVLELSTQGEFERIDLGTKAHPIRKIDQPINIKSDKSTIKWYLFFAKNKKISARCENLMPVVLEDNKTRGLVHVEPEDLGERLWRVEKDPDGPFIQVNNCSQLDMLGKMNEPLYRGLILINALEQFLEVYSENPDAESAGDWQEDWAQYFFEHGIDALPEKADAGDKKKWIEETLKSMSDLFKLKTALLQQEKS
jgi:hypothetical protein